MNIEILIQGTKGGAKTFYSTNPMGSESVFYRFAGDMRRSDNNGVTDWVAYSVALAGSGCIFSKYIGIYDIGRQFGGNVSFSVYLPNSRRLDGSDIIALLDTLASTYKNRYAPDGKLGNVEEDWDFVHQLAATYENKLKSAPSGNRFIEAGRDAPAFAYYDDLAELELYLTYPLQEVYRPYRQVFLINKEYKDDGNNPLGQLNHTPTGDFTGKIEFNITYILRDFNRNARGGIVISLLKDNRQLKNGDTILSQEILHLGYYRDYYSPIEVEGTVNDASMARYLTFDDNYISVRNNDIQLQPKKKTISLDIRNHYQEPLVRGIEIECYRNYVKKERQKDGILLFSGEEIGLEWTIRASDKNEGEAIEHFIPANNADTLLLTLHQRKIIKFEVMGDDGKRLNNRCKIRIGKVDFGASINLSMSLQYEFRDNNIAEEYNIVIECEGYQSYSTTIIPKRCDDTKTFTLQCDHNYRQRHNSTNRPSHPYETQDLPGDSTNRSPYYRIVIDKKAFKGPYDETCPNDPMFKPKPKWGFRFTEWKKNEYTNPIGSCKGTHEACYKELWWHTPIFLLALIILSIAIVLYFVFFGKWKDEHIDIEQIESYIQGEYGDNIDSLHAFEARYKAQKDIIDSAEFTEGLLLINEAIKESESKAKEDWIQQLIAKIEDYLDGTELKPDQLRKYKEEANNAMLDDKLIQQIDKAILLRDTLGRGSITFIIDDMNYPFNENQMPLLDALKRTAKSDSSRDHVAGILNKDKIKDMSLIEVADFVKELVSAYTHGKKGKTVSSNQETKKDKSNEQAINAFWDLVNNRQSKKGDFSNLLNKYSNFLNQNYKSFIQTITASNDNFKKYENIPIINKIKIVKSKDLVKLINEYNIQKDKK